jgi:hypothetical protein
MKSFKQNMLFASLFILFSSQVYAGTCEIHTTRTACAGKEDISYKKCDGNQSCSEFVEAASAQECAQLATQSCENKRLDITKSKVITANFDEQKVQSSTGKDDLCTDYKNTAAEFNKCP